MSVGVLPLTDARAMELESGRNDDDDGIAGCLC
jgi:hypothetical protein